MCHINILGIKIDMYIRYTNKFSLSDYLYDFSELILKQHLILLKRSKQLN